MSSGKILHSVISGSISKMQKANFYHFTNTLISAGNNIISFMAINKKKILAVKTSNLNSWSHWRAVSTETFLG